MRPEIVIIGGGPAGSAAAARLAEGGMAVLLVERTPRRHQKVCGEFVSADAIGHLTRLGVDPVRLGALPVERVRLCAGGIEADAPLPFPALSLGREAMDEALLTAARAQGATIRRGARVTRLEPAADHVIAWLGSERIVARAAVLATGKHELRGFRRPPPGRPMLGLKCYLVLAPPQRRALEGQVELHLFRGGYAGLQPVTGGLANLCLALDPAVYAAIGGDFPALMRQLADRSPRLAERLAGAALAWPKPLAVAGLPYGFVYRAAADERTCGTVYRVGDQVAVIPSFCGDGMTIALDSGRTAAERLLAGVPPADGATYGRQVGTAAALSAVMGLPLLPVLAAGLARTLSGLLSWLALRTRVGAPAPVDAPQNGG